MLKQALSLFIIGLLALTSGGCSEAINQSEAICNEKDLPMNLNKNYVDKIYDVMNNTKYSPGNNLTPEVHGHGYIWLSWQRADNDSVYDHEDGFLFNRYEIYLNGANISTITDRFATSYYNINVENLLSSNSWQVVAVYDLYQGGSVHSTFEFPYDGGNSYYFTNPALPPIISGSWDENHPKITGSRAYCYGYTFYGRSIEYKIGGGNWNILVSLGNTFYTDTRYEKPDKFTPPEQITTVFYRAKDALRNYQGYVVTTNYSNVISFDILTNWIY